MLDAIAMYSSGGYTLEEAAKAKGVPRNTLRDNYHKFRKKGADAVMPPLGRRQVWQTFLI